jgi:hypothetical protein
MVRTSRQHSTHGGSCGLVAVWPEVAVGVERRLDAAVPEAVLHDLDVEPAADQQRGQVVPEVVEPEGLW